MKQENKKIIIISVIVALIIIAGILAITQWGFYKELKYEQSQKIDIYIEKEFDENKIKEIANEVLGIHNMVQTVELYKDTVTIRARSITEEQKNNIVNKIKESYDFAQTAENTSITTVPATRIRDMYKKYILPFIISAVLVEVYIVIRYYKKGILKVLLNAILIPIASELVLLSWIAIVRIPVGTYTTSLVILVYMLSVWYSMKRIEKINK